MKRVFLAGFVTLFLTSSVTYAQNSRYDDDIYYTKKDAKKDAEIQKSAEEEYEARRKAEAIRNGDNDGGDEAYIDYDDDDYYYNRFNRFGSGSFYRPYWYNDPWYYNTYSYYGMGYGWNNWGYSPGWSVSIGYGGPYWSSYWGYNYWYGYPGFYSCWNYPVYGYGWGGYGGGYYNGYWDGYYNGAYNNSGGYSNRAYTYGPRTSMNRSYTGLRSNTGNRPAPNWGNNNQTPVAPQRSAAPGGNQTYEPRGRAYSEPGRTINERPAYSGAEPGNRPSRSEPNYNSGGTISNVPSERPRFEEAQQQPQRYEQARPERYQQSQPRYEQAQPQQREQPRYEQPRYEQPRQQSQPSYNTPSRGGWGGGSSGGSRGGSFNGGRR